jgi:iron complex outermembrane recepter protein
MALRPAPGGVDAATVAADEGSSPHQQVKVQSYFDVSRNLEFNVTFRFIGMLPYYQVGSYSTGDARFAWRPGHGVEFAVVGQNLLQPHHAEYGVDPAGPVGIRRSAYASLTFRK